MPKIAMAVAVPTASTEALRVVRAVTEASMEGSRRKLARGKSGIFFSAQLFMNDHVEVAERIRRLIKGLRDAKLEPFIIEIPDDMNWAEVTDLDRYHVDTDEILDLLTQAERRYG